MTAIRDSPRGGVAARRLILDAVAAEVISALREAGVTPILLKGPSIARWIYGPGEVRGYGDIDLLVSNDHLTAGVQRLEGSGFERISVELAGDRSDAVQGWSRPADGVSVDLHHGIVGVELEAGPSWAIWDRERERMEVGGVMVDVLSPRARALHLALHAAQHGPGVAQPLEDLSRGLQGLDQRLWVEARDLARRLEATEAMAAGLMLTDQGGAVVARLGLQAPTMGPTALRAGGAGNPVLFFEHLSHVHGLSHRLKLLGRKLVPPPRYMRSWIDTAGLPVSNIFLAYLYRPWWLLKVGSTALRERRRLRSGAADDPGTGTSTSGRTE